MRTRPALLYEARLVAEPSGLLPCLGLPVYAALSWLLSGGPAGETPLPMIANAFEIILPLAAGLSAAHLMTIETEAGFDDLRRSYPELRLRLPLLRGGAALFFLLLAVVLGAVAFHWIWGPFDIFAAALPALAPALFLSGLSLFAGGLSHSYWGAAGGVMGWWFLDLQTRGQVTGALFLFDTVWPVTNVPYALNRALLAGLGLVFFALNAVWFARVGKGQMRRGTLGSR
jgi:hypothetical protein